MGSLVADEDDARVDKAAKRQRCRERDIGMTRGLSRSRKTQAGGLGIYSAEAADCWECDPDIT